MALIAHWPLNGDILDYSGNGFHLTNNGATINNEGKIGKCYEFLNSNQYLDTKIQNQINSDNFCISFWVYIKEQNCQKYIFGNNLGDNQRLAFSLFDNYFSLSYGNIGWGNKIFNYELNKWYNIIINCKEDLKIFINNEFKYSIKSQKFLFPSFLKIGGRKDTINSPLIKINDFKIFNHELSKKEIKELYQTKILDWKFNECEEPTINLLNTKNLSTYSAYSNIIKNQNNEIVFKMKMENTYLTLATDAVNNKLITISGYIYKNNKPFKWQNSQSANTYNSSNDNKNKIFNDNGYFEFTEFYSTTGKWLFHRIIDCLIDDEIMIKNLQIEEKEYSTKYVPNERKGKIIDSSGYKNHGLIEINSSPKWDENNKSYFFKNHLIKKNNFILPEQITINTFIKKSNVNGGSNYHIPLSCSSGIAEISITNSNEIRTGFYINNKREVFNSQPQNFGNKFNMITVTYDKKIIKVYFNSVLISTKEIVGDLYKQHCNLFLGNFDNNSEYFSQEIEQKELKIFSIALDEKDIKELYENSITIDKNNNIICNEIVEEKNLLNSNIIIQKAKEYNQNDQIKTLIYDNKLCLKLKANAFHNGEYLNIFTDNYFKNNTKYEINFNVNSNLIYQGNEVPSGFRIYYNDGTLYDYLFSTSGTWQNKKIISADDKTIIKIGVYYYIGDDFYLDLESSYIKEYIIPDKLNDKYGNLYKNINEIDYVDTTKINKNNELICNTISEV